METRSLLGRASQAIPFAREGLWHMRHPDASTFQCGPLALAELPGPRPLLETNSAPRTGGYTLAELLDLAHAQGRRLTALYRRPGTGARVPVPSVAHWKSGHYAALLGEETRATGHYYHVRDRALDRDAWVSEDSLDDEASGYFLAEVPSSSSSSSSSSPLPADWRLASREEAQGVVGAGVTSGFGGAGAGGPEGGCPAGGDVPGGVGETGCNQGCIGGGDDAPMMQAATEAMIVSLSLYDTPLRYTPARGPRVPLTLVYNQRELNQPATFPYGNVGPHWSFTGTAHIIDTPASPAAPVKRYLSSGGARTQQGFDAASQRFAPDEADQSVLARVSAEPIVYERRLADGGREIYAAALSQGTIRRVFLSRAVDAAGNALDYHSETLDGQAATLRLTGFTDASGGRTRIEYGHADPLKITALVDPFGRRASLAYDAQGHLQRITDVLGLVSQVSYQGTGGFIERLDTPYGATHFAYGESGMSRWLEITDAKGHRERIETRHNAPGIPYSESQVPAGIRVFNAYLSSRNTFHWDGEAQARHPGDYGRAEIRHWFHDGSNTQWTANVLESRKRPLEGRVWYNYPNQVSDHGTGNCSKPSAIARVLPDGRTQLTQFSYNLQGKPTSRIDPLGRETRFEYAENGIDLLTVRQKTNRGFDTLAQITWNERHRPLRVQDAAGRVTQYTWNAAGQLASQTNALGQTTRYRYDAAGRLVAVVNPLGHVEAGYTYDAFGNLASETDAAGHRLQHAHDAANRRIRTIYPDGTTTEYTWDRLDLVQIKDRLGRRASYQYDATRRLIAERDALRALHYAYDAAGRLIGLTDGRGNTTTWERDLQGRVIAKGTPDGARTSVEYDAAGRRIARADALGQRRILSYGLDDRLTGITYENAVQPTEGVRFVWEAHYPRLAALSDGTGTTQYSYKPAGAAGAGRLAAEAGPSRIANIHLTYDALGRLQGRTIGTEMETYGFDALGRLVSNKNSALGTFRYGYLGDTGQLARAALRNAPLQRAYHYGDNRQDRRLKEIHHPLARGYRYDSAPEEIITGIVEHDAGGERRWQYRYDAVGRLRGARRGDRQDFAYALDEADNLTAIHDPEGGRTYRHDAGNRIGQTPFRYDANGNRLEDEYRTYRWDAENRLIGIGYKAEPQRASEFRYDGLGRRVAVIEQSGSQRSETRFAWCGDTICQARDDSDRVIAYSFAEGIFRPEPGTAASQRQGRREYFARDHLGSVRDVRDEAGRRLASFDYDPYGNLMNEPPSAPEFGYAGMFYHAPSGLYLTKYRVYDPQTGRWLSRDPIEEAGGVNLYAYVGGNPVSYVDPDGLRVRPPPIPGNFGRSPYVPYPWRKDYYRDYREGHIKSICAEYSCPFSNPANECSPNNPLGEPVTWRGGSFFSVTGSGAMLGCVCTRYMLEWFPGWDIPNLIRNLTGG
jgi:RHS repeat-associated protein